MFDILASMLNSKISIIGAGWLGLALAKSFKQAGAEIKLSCRSENKREALIAKGFNTYLLDIEDSSTFNTELFDADTYIICISGVLNDAKDARYWFDIFTDFFSWIKQRHPKKVLLMSSTGVIPNVGKEVSEVDAEKLTLVKSFSLSAEQALQHIQNWPAYIFRLGGLIGPGRDLTKYFTGRRGIPNGHAPVNLIHLSDLISVLKKAVEEQIPNPVIHVVNPQHPTRESYYTQLCSLFNLAAPDFLPVKSDWKIVNSVYILQLYEYKINLENLRSSDFITST